MDTETKRYYYGFVTAFSLIGLIVLWAIIRGPQDDSLPRPSSIKPETTRPVSTSNVSDSAVAEKPSYIDKDTLDRSLVIVKQNWKWTLGDYNYDYIRGSVFNGSDRKVTYWKVTVDFSDKKKNIIDSAYTNDLGPLMPKAAKRFEIMHSHISESRGGQCSCRRSTIRRLNFPSKMSEKSDIFTDTLWPLYPDPTATCASASTTPTAICR